MVSRRFENAIRLGDVAEVEELLKRGVNDSHFVTEVAVGPEPTGRTSIYRAKNLMRSGKILDVDFCWEQF